MKKKSDKTPKQLRAEIDELNARLREAEDTIQAIREGAVDALVVSGPRGEQIFTLSGEDVVYRQLVETMQEAGLTTTPEGRILFCNQRFAAMVGQPMELVVGRPLDEFVAPFDHRTAVALLVGAQVRPTRKRLVFRAPDGTLVPTSVAANILEQAGPPKICIVAADLTELEASEQALEETEAEKEALAENAAALYKSRQSALNLMEEAVAAREQAERLTEQLRLAKDEWENTFNTIPDLIGIFDNQFRMVRVNRAMAERIGKTIDECIGLTCYETVHGANGPPAYCPHAKTLANGEEHTAEVHEPVLGGDFLVSTTPMFDDQGRVTASIHVARDITERKKAEEALRQSEARLTATLRSTVDEVWLVDAQGRIVSISDSVGKSLGVSADKWADIEAVLNQLEIFRPDGSPRPKEEAILPRALRGEVITDEQEMVRNLATGQLRWREVSGSPIRDADGGIIGAVAVVRDITERKETEENLQRSEREKTLILENSSAMIAYHDKDHNIIWANKAYLDSVGKTLDEVRGRKCYHAWGLHKLCEHCPITEAMSSDKSMIAEMTPQNQPDWSAEQGSWLVRAAPVKDSDGNIIGAIEMAEDITERKAADQERQKLLDQLADKNKELQSIVYVASHDLRSPLLNVYGFSGQLAEQVETLRKIMKEAADIEEAKEKAKEIFEKDLPENLAFIKAGAEKMQMLINGLLTMSRIGTVPLHIETIDMNKLFAKITSAVSYEAKEKGAKITVGELPACKGDAVQINQLFSNILSNALKYLDPARKGRIEVSGQHEGEMSVFSVSDNGVGISAEHKERIFEIFHRLNPKNGIAGEGLGLSIVLRIVDRHGGRIWVDSTPQKGSTFHVALPAL